MKIVQTEVVSYPDGYNAVYTNIALTVEKEIATIIYEDHCLELPQRALKHLKTLLDNMEKL